MIDRLALADGWLEGLLGGSARFSVTPVAGNLDNLLDVSVTSERLSGSGRLQMGPGGLSLEGTGSAHLELTPSFAQRVLGLNDKNNALRVVEPISIDLTLSQLTLGPAPLVMDPAIFALDGVVTAPSVILATRNGDRIEILSTSIQVRKSDQAGAIDFDLSSASITTEAGSHRSPKSVRIDGLGPRAQPSADEPPLNRGRRSAPARRAESRPEHRLRCDLAAASAR